MKHSFLLIALIAVLGCVGPLVPVKKIDELPVSIKREVLAMPIYNESQLIGKQYKVINIVKAFLAKTRPGIQRQQKQMRSTKPNTGRTKWALMPF